jgi:hypothetical protein
MFRWWMMLLLADEPRRTRPIVTYYVEAAQAWSPGMEIGAGETE